MARERYTAKRRDELSFEAGDTLFIVEQCRGGMWILERDHVVGLAPEKLLHVGRIDDDLSVRLSASRAHPHRHLRARGPGHAHSTHRAARITRRTLAARQHMLSACLPGPLRPQLGARGQPAAAQLPGRPTRCGRRRTAR